MIKDLANCLKENVDVWCGEAVDPLFLKDCKEYLKIEGKCDLPADYVTLLRYVNGAFSDDVYLFGVQPENWPGLDDVVEQNEKYNSEFSDNIIFLGTNDFDWLVYDAQTQNFQIRSRIQGEIVRIFPDFESAIRLWFALD